MVAKESFKPYNHERVPVCWNITLATLGTKRYNHLLVVAMFSIWKLTVFGKARAAGNMPGVRNVPLPFNSEC